MDENVQQKITLACIALLQKNEDAVVLDESAIIGSTRALHQQQWAAKKQMWETVAQRTDLTSEQRAQVVKALKALKALEGYRWLLKGLKG